MENPARYQEMGHYNDPTFHHGGHAMATSEAARIDDELRRAFDGECWHGPSVAEVLHGVTAEVAARKHPALVHSIWELVHHLTAWVEVVRLRVAEGQTITDLPGGNFPPVTDTSAAAWTAAVAELGATVGRLRGVAVALTPDRLDEFTPGRAESVAVELHGTAQHLAYHGGQIALLKKLVG